MTIPQFDQHGLLPPGVWNCTLDEIGAILCWTDKRRAIFDNLNHFLDREWRPLGIACPIFVDGSFVRNKPNPDDVDVVLDLEAVTEIEPLALALALRFRHDDLKDTYNVDVWPKHPELPHDLSTFFQYIGEKAAAELKLDSKHPKGILRIVP